MALPLKEVIISLGRQDKKMHKTESPLRLAQPWSKSLRCHCCWITEGGSGYKNWIFWRTRWALSWRDTYFSLAPLLSGEKQWRKSMFLIHLQSLEGHWQDSLFSEYYYINKLRGNRENSSNCETTFIMISTWIAVKTRLWKSVPCLVDVFVLVVVSFSCFFWS